MHQQVSRVINPLLSLQVGWVGLGRMGSRMVNNLLDAGNNVVVYDSNKVGHSSALWQSSSSCVRIECSTHQ